MTEKSEVSGGTTTNQVVSVDFSTEVLLICATLTLILCWGSPDLLDALIHFLMKA